MANTDGMSCRTCKWFWVWSREKRSRSCRSGDCMYNPPVYDPDSDCEGRPSVHFDDYCSRYEKRNEEKENVDA